MILPFTVGWIYDDCSLEGIGIIGTWNPTDPCFDWNFGLVLGGENPSKTEVIKGFQVYTYQISGEVV